MNELIINSKDPHRQVVLDYMGSLGLHILKANNGAVYMIKADGIHPNELMRLTSYHAKLFNGFVIVEFDDGRSFRGGRNLVEAYEALEYLYNIMRTAEADADF